MMLRDALRAFEIKDLFVTPVLESALLRMGQAHRRRDDQDPILLAVLAALDDRRTAGAPPVQGRPVLESLATLVAERNPRLADAAWTTVYVLYDRPRQDESVSIPPEDAVVLSPQAMEELARFENFHLERLPAGEAYLALARGRRTPAMSDSSRLSSLTASILRPQDFNAGISWPFMP